MIAKNRVQLKVWIKNMSTKVDVNENIILQNYMLERILISYEDTMKVLEEITNLARKGIMEYDKNR